MRHSLGLLFILILAGPIQSQYVHKLERKALRAWEGEEYLKALDYFDAILLNSNRSDLLYKAGIAALNVKDYRAAIAYFQRIPFNERNDQLSETDYWLAMAYKSVGEYDRAVAYLQRFLNTHPDNEALHAHEEVEKIRWAQRHITQAVKLKIRNAGLGVNTPADEVAPLLYADRLLFASNAAGEFELLSRITGFKATKAKEAPDRSEGSISDVVLSADAQIMFFSTCDSRTGKCQLFQRLKEFEGHWGSPKPLPRFINLEGYTATQPAYGFDRYLRRFVLWFVSDRPGGAGGLDIWYSIQNRDGTFEEPKPWPHNTPGNEITPYFHQASQTLFFSSDKLDGFGGYDVFKSTLIDAESWSDPVNLGNPLNTSYDECYLTFHSRTKRAFFCSNRPGGIPSGDRRGLPGFDIYEAEVFVELKPILQDAANGLRLCGATLFVEELITGENKAIQLPANCEGFTMPLDLERVYRIKVLVKDHLPVTFEVSTLGVNFSKTFEPVVPVQPDDSAAVFHFIHAIAGF